MANNLAQRTASAVASKDNGGPTLVQLIEQMKPQIQRALPKHMDADKLARIALTVLRQTPKLGQCTAESFLGALLTSAQLGLEPGPLGEAYLVPYGNVCTFIPGYKGLLKLAWQSNQMRTFQAHVVRDGDMFDYEFGLEPFLRHKPTRETPGKPTDIYAAATFLNGGSAFEVLSVPDVELIRKRSKTPNAGPWVSDWSEMAKKSVIKRLVKLLPLSTELQQLQRAVQLDGSSRVDLAPITEAAIDYVDTDDAAIEPGSPAPATTDEPYDAEAEAAAMWDTTNEPSA